ncbi:MAG: synaptobrevin-domain-containing protein [Monoraphidium minutum]|nr:MAG: synaptobrevin-domain-containing protein [Monoraphidium minutum]
MPLIYSAVARGEAVLAEYSVFAGNFCPVAKGFLARAAAGGRFSHTVDNHVFSFLQEGGYSFVVVTDEAAGRTIPNAFLDRLQQDFVAKYGDKGKGLAEGGLSSYSKKLKELMEHATQFPEEYSKVAGVQKKVDEVKNIMSDNIEKVLARGEKLDLLVDKTDNLMFEADRFVKSGRALRRKMWWNNCKMKVVMAGVVVMVLFIIMLLFCFSAGGTRCIKRKHHSAPGASPAPGAGPTAAAAAPPLPAAPPAAAPQPGLDGAAAAPGGGSRRRLMFEVARGVIEHAMR